MFKRLSAVLVCVLLGLLTVIHVGVMAQGSGNQATPTQISQANSVQILNQVGGSVNGVVVSGTYAYVGMGPRVQIYDVQQPDAPLLVGETAVLPQMVGYLDVSGSKVYAALKRGIAVIDVSNPANPQIAQIVPTTGIVGNVAVHGSYIFAVEYSVEATGLLVYERSTMGTLSETAVLPITGSFLDFTLSGNYLYLTGDNYPDAFLKVINIANPQLPTEIGSFYRGEYAANQTGITVLGNYLYTGVILSGSYNLAIFSLTNPAAPSMVKLHEGPFHVRAIEVVDNLAYIAGSSGGFRLVNVANPSTPLDVDDYKASVPGVVFAVDVEKHNDAVYMAYQDIGLHVLDVSQTNSVTATLVINEMGNASGIANVSGKLYIADRFDGFKIFTGGGTPDLFLESHSSPGFFTLANLSATGDKVYAASSPSYFSNPGLVRFSVNEVLTPTLDGAYTPSGHLENYVVEDNNAYIAAYDEGLQIADFSVLPPVKSGELVTGVSYVGDVALQGNYAYLADETNGLKIIDITNPALPSEVSSLNLGRTESLAVYDDYAYVITQKMYPAVGSILNVVDISNPISPTAVISMNHAMELRTPTVINDRLYVHKYAVGDQNSLLGYDLSEPAAPVLLFEIDLPGWFEQIEAAGPYAYAAVSNAGVIILGPAVPLDKHVYLPMILR